ncbi:MAG: trehalose-phosphatase [Actinomycetes bacterium]
MPAPRPTTDAGRAGTAALLADPGRALVALDYDGTLAPVVERPEDAVPAPGAVDALSRLAARVGRVALVTGRPAAVVVELGGLHGVPGLVVQGQYGAERWADGALTGAEPLPGLDRLRDVLPDLAAAEGAHVEDKGLSLVVHTRRAPDPAGALERLRPRLAELAAGAGLEAHPGRLVVELRPPGHDKAGALLALCDPAPSAVLFAGDDVGDLAAFDAVDALRRQGVPGVLVCSASDEGPPALRERADVVVAGPAGVVALLAELADQLG